MVFSPKATAFQSLLKGATLTSAGSLESQIKYCYCIFSSNERAQRYSKHAIWSFWEGFRFGKGLESQNFLGQSVRYVFNLFLLFHSESFWSAKGESELWKQSAAISCNQVARLPNVTDRMLPSSPSCQLQGMLWVNLLLPFSSVFEKWSEACQLTVTVVLIFSWSKQWSTCFCFLTWEVKVHLLWIATFCFIPAFAQQESWGMIGPPLPIAAANNWQINNARKHRPANHNHVIRKMTDVRSMSLDWFGSGLLILWLFDALWAHDEMLAWA